MAQPSTMNSSAFRAITLVDIHELAIEIGKERPPVYPNIVKTGPMDYNPYTDQQMSGTGTLAEMPEGEQFVLDRPIMGGRVTVSARNWGIAFELTFVGNRDEKYGAFMEIVGDGLRAARNKKETRAHEVLNDAFTGTTYTGFDSLQLCSTAHTYLDGGGTQANRPSPDVGFSKTAVQNMLMTFARFKNVGRRWNDVIQPEKGVIGPLNRFAAREILGSSGNPYTADNELNALIPENQAWVETPYLTTEANWFFRAADHDVRYEIMTDVMTNSFEDPWTMSTVYTIWFSDAASFKRWPGWYGSTG